jgi:hypothetical protein
MSRSGSTKRRNAHDDWATKYRPSRLSQMVGDRSHLKQLSSWLADVRNEKTSQTTAIVSGDHGVGKTLGVELVLRESGYDPKVLDLAALRTNGGEANGDIRRYLLRITTSQDVNAMLHQTKQRRIAIVIDNIDAIKSKQEREGLKAVHKYNEKNRLFPLIIISTANHSKLLSKIRDSCKIINFPQPGYNDLLEMINRISAKEGFKIEGVRDLILNAQGDVCRLLNHLEELRRIYSGKSKIDSKAVRDLCATLQMKDTNIGLFDQVKILLHRFPGMEQAQRMFSSDKVILPLMVHENYPNAMSVRKQALQLKEDDIFDGMEAMAESISFGDILENHIHGEQLWDMMDTHGFFSCAYPAWYINKWEKDSTYETLKFCVDVNKVYIKKINYGHIRTVRPFFSDRTTEGYLIAAKITAKLIADNDIDSLRSLFIGYPGIGAMHIEALLKINKICNTVKVKREKRNKILIKVFAGEVVAKPVLNAASSLLIEEIE